MVRSFINGRIVIVFIPLVICVALPILLLFRADFQTLYRFREHRNGTLDIGNFLILCARETRASVPGDARMTTFVTRLANRDAFSYARKLSEGVIKSSSFHTNRLKGHLKIVSYIYSTRLRT
jgi:hypothetical protein